MNGHNPDILTCLANLSADEVFTPPKLASAMLDILPQDLFRRPDTTFLDPVCKSGVFLREIARRLNDGLKDQMPDEQARINHILTKQVFGLAITELTALLSRRSVYCSKKADGKYSIATAFPKPDGNIRLPKTDHTWNAAGKCELCGANQGEYDRDETFEAYAYPFIHGIDPTEVFNVKFDVIIGNPPYQLSDGGFGRSASPIYHQFVRQAKKLEPRYLTMIIPSRWFGGGKGLDDFREEMLADDRVRRIVDFEDVNDVFSGIDLAGGVCYFLWDRDNPGLCSVTNVHGNTETTSERRLDEFKTFIRHGEAVSIVRKVVEKDEARMNKQVSGRKPFGLATTERPKKTGDLVLRWQKGEGPYPRDEITTGIEMINRWKVITSYVGHDHAGNPGTDGRRRVLSKIDIIPPGTICNETYLVIGHYTSKKEAENLVAYMKTRFFRFLVSQFMYSHHITKEAYALVPVLDMKHHWNDAELIARYGLTTDEVVFIESKIRSFDRTED
ncbi:MAG: Eco57I restriction-modification methylase domain-containing protein [Planctomycetes bacterium]|nr:Eco57I restriction-modification methylase domain-containing protein [Planctomycetota bacterium]